MSAAFCGNRQKDPQRNQHQLGLIQQFSISESYLIRALCFAIFSCPGCLVRGHISIIRSVLIFWFHLQQQDEGAGIEFKHGSWEGKSIELVRPAELMALIILKAVERLGFVRWRQWSTQDFLVYIKFSLNEKGQKDDTGKCFKYIYWT